MIVSIPKNPRLFENIYEQMISMILEGVWPEGERLPGEETLAKQFSVSRNSLRIAIKVLHASEILESKPGLGTFVGEDALRNIHNSQLVSRMQDDHSFDDVMDVRYIIEKETAYLAAFRRTDEEIRQLEMLVDKLEEAVAGVDRDAAVECGSQFHLQIIRMTHNPILASIYESLLYSVNEEKKSYIQSTEKFQQMYDFYIKRDRALVQALRDRDGILARTLVEEHVNSKKDIRKRTY